MNCTEATCACSATATAGAAGVVAPTPEGAVLTRRRVVATTVLGAVAATALAACGGDDGAATTTQPSAGDTGSASAGGDATASATEGSSSGDGVLAKLADIPVGGATSGQTADGTAIILSQPSAGKVVAFDARCPHQGCTVAPAGDKLACPCHGSSFKTADGSLINGPATRGLTEVAVKVDGDDVVAG